MSLSQLNSMVLEEEKLISYKDTLTANCNEIEFDKSISQNRKCGEIVINENDIFTFWCVFCSETSFVEISEFFMHFKQHHTKLSCISEKLDPLEPNDDDQYEEITIEPVKDEIELTNVECTYYPTTVEENHIVLVSNNRQTNEELCVSTILNKDTTNNISDKSNEESQSVSLVDTKIFDCNNKKHKKKHQPIKEKITTDQVSNIFDCGECNKRYFAKSSLNRHHKQHPECKGKSKIYRLLTLNCDMCDKKFLSEESLEKHKIFEHELSDSYEKIKANQVSEIFQCGTCDKRYLAKSSLERHHNQRPECKAISKIYQVSVLVCDVCNRNFLSEETLEKHKMFEHELRVDSAKIKIEPIENEIEFTDTECTSNQSEEAQNVSSVDTKTFDCDICNKKYTIENLLKKHQQKHQVNCNQLSKVFECGTCNRIYLAKSSLKRHHDMHPECEKNSKIYQVSMLTCGVCDKKFPSQQTLEKHKFLEHDLSDNDEKIKTEPTDSEMELTNVEYASNQPVIEIDSDEVTSNNYCMTDNELSTRNYLNTDSGNSILEKSSEEAQNVSLMRAKLFKCNTCKKRFPNKYALQNHQKKLPECRVNLKIFNCDVCDKEFMSERFLNTHKFYIHEPLDPFLKTIKIQKQQPDVINNDDDENDLGAACRSENSSSSLLVGEIEDPLKCRYCGHKCKTLKSRIDHEHIHTGEKPYKCEKCGKCFRSKIYIRTHLMIHNGIKPYKCTMCDAAFTGKSNLQQHIRRHLGDKKVSCSYCEKSFQQPNEKKMHERIHTGEKPYQCNICGICFRRSGNLNIHIARHQNPKPFKCEDCDTCFGFKYDLREHRNIHTGEKPHSCEICNAAFSRRKALKLHRKRHLNVA